MSGCCPEYGCRRKQPYKIRLTPFSRRVILITRYKTRKDHPNLIVAAEKHDVTDEIVAFAKDQGWTIPDDWPGEG